MQDTSPRNRNRDPAMGEAAIEAMSNATAAWIAGWTIDWEDEPFRFKLYRGVPTVALDPRIPVAAETGRWSTSAPLEARLSHLLHYSCGLSANRWSLDPGLEIASAPHGEMAPGERLEIRPSLFLGYRFVPSGGGLFPWEAYLSLGPGHDLGPGVYHYDAAHHRLDLLRSGDHRELLASALGHRVDPSRCGLAVLTTASFWKNYFKYSNVSLRLHGLDVGIVQGQLQALARRFGLAARVCWQFLDAPVADLLGVDREREPPFAIALLAEGDEPPAVGETRSGGAAPAGLPPLRAEVLQRSKNVKDFPLLRELALASTLQTADEMVPPSRVEGRGSASRPDLVLPDSGIEPPDLAKALRWRESGLDNHLGRPLLQAELAQLCAGAMAGFPDDLHPVARHLEKVELYCVANHVRELPRGAYRFLPESRGLESVRSGDLRLGVQQAYQLLNVNLSLASAVLFLVGDPARAIEVYGNRGFRILHLEAGVATQRICLTAAGLELGAHALLGFRLDHVAGLLQLPPGSVMLLGIAVGRRRERSAVQIRLPLWS